MTTSEKWLRSITDLPEQITGLHLAAYLGVDDAVRDLLSSNSPDLKDDYGQTPLAWAARNGHEAVLKLLLATGTVEVNSKDKQGWTPLSWAAENGHEAVVRLLLATGTVEVNSKDVYGRTALSWAAENGHEAVVKLLLATGTVEVDSKDVYGQTPLLFAANKGHETCLLCRSIGKVDVNSKD